MGTLGFSELTVSKKLHAVGGGPYCNQWGWGTTPFTASGGSVQLWISSKMLCHAWGQKELLETRKDELRESILKSPVEKGHSEMR